jgi:hypothetical protein
MQQLWDDTVSGKPKYTEKNLVPLPVRHEAHADRPSNEKRRLKRQARQLTAWTMVKNFLRIKIP